MTTIPIEVCEQILGDGIEQHKPHLHGPGGEGCKALQLLLSISEYLKDARRWQFFRDNSVWLSPELEPSEVQRAIDAHIQSKTMTESKKT
jgi:hypothetical protein